MAVPTNIPDQDRRTSVPVAQAAQARSSARHQTTNSPGAANVSSFQSHVESGGGAVPQQQAEWTPAATHDIDSKEWDAPVYIDYGTSHGYLDAAARQGIASGQMAGGIQVNVPSGFNIPAGPYQGHFSEMFPATAPSTIGDADRLYWLASPEERAHYQMMLVNAGFDLDEPVGGWGAAFDKKYADAWEWAVKTAHRTGVPLMAMLRGLGEQNQGLARLGGGGRGGGRGGGGGGGGGPKRPAIQLISEDDAREIIDQVAKQEMGRALSDEEEKVAKAIIGAIHGRQRSEQNRAIDVQMAGGGEFQAPTSVDVLAKGAVEDNFETETGAWDLAGAFVNFVRAAGGGA